MHYFLSNSKILDKVKAFADGKILANVPEKLELFQEGWKNIVGKRENAGY